MRFKKRSKFRSLTVMAVPNELNLLNKNDTHSNKVQLHEEPPPGSSNSHNNPKSIFNRFRSFMGPNLDQDFQRRTIEVYRLYDSERWYNERLHQVIQAVNQLRISDGLPVKLLDVVEQSLQDVAAVSDNLLQSLEKIISTRSASIDALASLFDDNFWNDYNRFHLLYCSAIKPHLHEFRHLIGLAQEKLLELDNSFGQPLEILFLLPEERIFAYSEHLRAIAAGTPRDHIDHVSLKRTANYVEHALFKSRLREISNLRNNDELLKLDYVISAYQSPKISRSSSSDIKMRQIAGRRKSTGGLSSTFGKSEKTSSSDDVYSGYTTMSRQRSQSKKQENFVRVYMKEGRILLSSGAQTQERYLFLFSDLLLVAKEKGVNSYRLKDRVRLSDVWICDANVTEISECVKNSQNSFVIGWPTKNYVAEFGSLEERNSWLDLLRKQIQVEKEREFPKRTSIWVNCKSGKKLQSRKIPVNNVETAADVLKAAFDEFATPVDERDSLQLWVQCGGKESQQFALYGHECVFAILLSYVRDLLPPTEEPDVDFSLVENSASSNGHFKCVFSLKPKRVSKKQKTPKRHGAGQLVSQLKKRVMIKQDSQDSMIVSPPCSSGGKLFGQPLSSLTESDSPPKPVLMLMENVLREGIFMEGIFRKPPNHKVFRELRDKLDSGVQVSFDGVQPSVSASLLKEFFRFLPDSVLGCANFSDWLSLCDESDISTKLKKAQRILKQLPAANYELLRYLLCLLCHVKNKEVVNQMNSYNLSICIGPSLINNAASMYQGPGADNMNAKRVVEIVQFLIENVVELLGADTLNLLGDVPEHPPHKHDSGEESDSFIAGNSRHDTSSVDSLVASSSSPGNSRPQSALRHPLPINVSRDSGLSEVHISSADDAVSSSTPRRSVSHIDDMADRHGFTMPNSNLAKSADNVSSSDKKSAPTNVKRSPTLFEEVFGESWNSGRFDTKNGGGSKAESTDSLYESLESTCSCDSTPVRQSRPLHVSTTNAATLIRSESGDHLISIVEMNPAINGIGVDRRHAFRQKTASLPFSMPVDSSSTDHSNAVSPSSSGFDSPRSRRATPSPVSVMTRYSAVRKPARHRKGPAPPPPQVENGATVVSLSVGDYDDDDGSVSDADTNDDIYEAQPIIIRCNSESGDSMCSVEDTPTLATEKRKASSHKTEVYSLKSPSVVDIVPFRKDFVMEGLKKTSSDLNIPTRKFSTSSQSSVDILTSLNEIKQQVASSANFHQKALLQSRLAPETINDSSTVTEASSEESTPHVSRESSRAQEYKQIADDMFKATPTTFSRPSSMLAATPPKFVNPTSNLVDDRPKFQRSVSNITQNRIPDLDSATYRAKLVSTTEYQKNRPPSYHEAISPYVQPSMVPVVEAIAHHTSGQMPRRVSVGPCTSEGAHAAAPTAPDHKLTIPVVSEHYRKNQQLQRRLRRKTLGGDELASMGAYYSKNSALDRSDSQVAAFNAYYDAEPADQTSKEREISWSVKQFINFFDKGAQMRDNQVETSRSRLPWTRDDLDLEVRSSAAPKRTISANYTNGSSGEPTIRNDPTVASYVGPNNRYQRANKPADVSYV